MKKIFIAIALFIGAVSMAQETKTEKYVAVGLSMHAQGQFQEQSYPSIEVGISKNDISYGAVFGRGSLVNVFKDEDTLDNYFWEVKIAPSYSIRKVTATVFAGAGAYFHTDHYFTEVGVGLSYRINNYSYGVSFSNWDTVNYITPSISYSF